MDNFKATLQQCTPNHPLLLLFDSGDVVLGVEGQSVDGKVGARLYVDVGRVVLGLFLEVGRLCVSSYCIS